MEQETNETFPFTTVHGNPDFSDQSITTNYAKHVKQPVSMGTDGKKINIYRKQLTRACRGYREPTVCFDNME